MNHTAGALGLAMSGRFARADEPGTMTAPRPRSAPSFEVPARACDTHVHIIGNTVRYPMTPDRVYTPPLASVDELRFMHKVLHLERVVVVQPSFYGTDNACTVDAIRMLGASARGIAANAERILWGSDWPHPDARPPGRAPNEITTWHDIDDAAIFNLLPTWEPDAAVRKKILVDNPARLYGFPA